MNKIIKKLLFLLAVMVLAFALIGCGGSGDGPEPPEPTEQEIVDPDEGYDFLETCPTCNGKTTELCTQCNGSGLMDIGAGIISRCTKCHGTGQMTCHTCYGLGHIYKNVNKDKN